MYFAHSTTDPTRADWQPLREHLTAVADLAEGFATTMGVERAARVAGLLHDLGKYSAAFQARLAGATERVDHSTAGAAIVRELAKGDDRVIAELIAYAIAGHHAGLPDMHSESFSCLAERVAGFSHATLDPAWKTEITPEVTGLVPRLHWKLQDRRRASFRLAFLGRMIFSCLVDADFKDTETFFARVERREVDRDWPRLQTVLPDLLQAFERKMGTLRSTTTAVNRLRTEILDHVRSRAPEPSGLFTLTVPTGGGKTLASLGFALDHAQAHGLERIIYAIPFTSIIDQTARIFRSIFGDDLILEHHSAIEEERRGREDARAADCLASSRDKLKLAMEDWAAPLVVTTNVQFFESLFAARPSRCRKLHNIARSIIILDEAQTLPRPLLAPAIWALRELSESYGCTIVLCTATQPALDERHFPADHPAGLPLAGRELAPDPAHLARELERVRLVHAGAMSDDALTAALETERQALVIVNSRKHALALYRQAQAAGLDGLVHLTTRQYATHRRQILERVRECLANQRPCRLIATSLVEAGVDLDFPRVWRAEAGLDQIAQAAGRCNREGRRPKEQSIVTIFTAPDNPPPAEIQGLCGDMVRMAHKHPDLLSPEAMEDFFGEVYWRIGAKGLDREGILDAFRIGRGGTDFAYRTVGEAFRMIDSGMTPVIVAGDDKARQAVKRLGVEQIPSGAIARDLQPYVVQVPPRARQRLIENGHVRFAEVRKRGEQFALLVTESLYEPEVGLVWEDADYMSLEDSII